MFNTLRNSRIPLKEVGVPYVVYWTTGAIFLGMMLAPVVLPNDPVPPALEDHSSHLTHDHMQHHGMVDVAGGPIPQVALYVIKDAASGWNLHIAVEDFTFTPEKVNGPNAGNTGHAHIYVDGEKVARLYGTAYYLADMAPGDHVVRVTLNANGHETLAHGGVPIAAETVITQ